MPQELTAVQCKQCKTLHAKEESYIIIDQAHIRVKVRDDAKRWDKDKAASVSFADIIVCDDRCLCMLLTMGNKD